MSNILEVGDATFEAEVLKAQEPVLVDFWAAWCQPCRMLAPKVEAISQKYAGKAKVTKLNVDDNSATSSRFGIKGIPTLILFKDGAEKERIVGVTSEENISKIIEKHLE